MLCFRLGNVGYTYVQNGKLAESWGLPYSRNIQISSLIPVRSLLDVPHLRLYIISAIGFGIIFWGNWLWELFGFNFPFKTFSSFHLWQSRDNKGFGTVFSIAATAFLACVKKTAKVALIEDNHGKNSTGKRTAGQLQSKWTWPKRAICPWPLKKRNTRTKNQGFRLLL